MGSSNGVMQAVQEMEEYHRIETSAQGYQYLIVFFDQLVPPDGVEDAMFERMISHRYKVKQCSYADYAKRGSLSALRMLFDLSKHSWYSAVGSQCTVIALPAGNRARPESWL